MGHRRPINVASRACTLAGWCWLLSSCSTIFSAPQNQPQQADTRPADTRRVAEDNQQNQPTMAKLQALEQDLSIIKEEIDKLVQVDNLPPQYANAQPYDLVQATQEVSYAQTSSGPASGQEPVNPADSTQFAIIIALYVHKESAGLGWQAIKQRQPKLFDGLTPLLDSSSRNQSRIFKLKVGPFSSREQAQAMCGALASARYNCEPSSFTGTPLAESWQPQKK